MELDSWVPSGHDGTVRGKKYFTSSAGRGYFTRRTSVSNVVLPLVKKASRPAHKPRPLRGMALATGAKFPVERAAWKIDTDRTGSTL